MKVRPILLTGLFAGLFLSSFLFSNYFFLSFELPKVIAVRLIITLIFVLFTAYYLGRFKFKLDLFDLLAIFWVFVLILSSVRSGNFLYSFWGGFFRHQGIFTQIHLALFFILSRRILAQFPEVLNNVLKILVAAGIFQSLIVIFQGFEFFVLKNDITTYAGRVFGTFGQPNMTAGMLAASFAVSLGLFLSGKEKKYIFFSIIIFAGLLMTESFGGLVASFGVFLVFLLYYVRSFSLKVTLIFLIIFGVIVFGITGLIKERIYYSDTNVPRIESRLSIWPQTVKLIIARPLLGYGAENLQLVFPGEFGGASIDRAHNQLLDTLIWGGVYLGAIYLAFVIFGLSKGLNANNKVFGFALIAILIRDMVNVSSIINLVLFWFVLSGAFIKEEQVSDSAVGKKTIAILISVLIFLAGLGANYKIGLADHYFSVFKETGNMSDFEEFSQNSLIPIPKE